MKKTVLTACGVVGLLLFAASAADAKQKSAESSGPFGVGRVVAGNMWCISTEYLHIASEDLSEGSYNQLAAHGICGKFKRTRNVFYDLSNSVSADDGSIMYYVKLGAKGFVYTKVNDAPMDDDGAEPIASASN